MNIAGKSHVGWLLTLLIALGVVFSFNLLPQLLEWFQR